MKMVREIKNVELNGSFVEYDVFLPLLQREKHERENVVYTAHKGDE